MNCILMQIEIAEADAVIAQEAKARLEAEAALISVDKTDKQVAPRTPGGPVKHKCWARPAGQIFKSASGSRV